MCPHSGFWGPGISKIIAFFCQGSTAGKDFLEEIPVQGKICQNHPFGNHPSANPREFLALSRMESNHLSLEKVLMQAPLVSVGSNAQRFKFEATHSKSLPLSEPELSEAIAAINTPLEEDAKMRSCGCCQWPGESLLPSSTRIIYLVPQSCWQAGRAR